MNSDQKIEMIKEIVNSGESVSTIIGQLHYGPQLQTLRSQTIGFTGAGKKHIDEMFEKGILPNTLKDCAIVVKIENSKVQVSVVHEGITVFEFKPVHSDFSVSTFEFTGISVPLKMGW